MANYQDNVNEIINLSQFIKKINNLLEYDNIDLYFQLFNQVLNLGESLFPCDQLKKLATEDSETLESWSIAFWQTLKYQQELVNNWTNCLSNLSIDNVLQEKIKSENKNLQAINQEQITLLQIYHNLLNQEQELKNKQKEIQQLKEKITKLKTIDKQIKQTKIEQLKKEVEQKSLFLEPRTKEIKFLQAKQLQLEEKNQKITQQQKETTTKIQDLTAENEKITHEINEQKIELKNQEEQLISNKQALTDILEELPLQKIQLTQIQNQLQKAIDDSNQYDIKIEKITNHINTHYQTNKNLAKILPINNTQIDRFVKEIEDDLTKLDKELSIIRQKNEKAKNIIKF